MIRRAGSGEAFQLTGTDYPTRDGSGLRDYVHVWDLAEAHLAALARFDEVLPGPGGSAAINLGTGTGTTVTELLAAFNLCVDRPLRPSRPDRAAPATSRASTPAAS